MKELHKGTSIGWNGTKESVFRTTQETKGAQTNTLAKTLCIPVIPATWEAEVEGSWSEIGR
jgi:hypothetical protein